MQIGTTFLISEFCMSNARFSHFGQSCRMLLRILIALSLPAQPKFV
jgi:hypothetical protein